MSHEVVHLLNPVPREKVNHLKKDLQLGFLYMYANILFQSINHVRGFGENNKRPFELIDKMEKPLEIIKKYEEVGT